MSQTSTPPPRRAQRPPRMNLKNLQTGGYGGGSAMPLSAQPPFSAQPPYTAQTAQTMPGSTVPGGQPYWPQYANPFAAGNFMAKGFEGFVDFTKSGMSFGEKFTYGLYDKFSKWSKKWFTHMFLLFVVTLFSVGGALLFGAVEERQFKINKIERHALQKSFFQAMLNLSKDLELRQYSPSTFNGQITNTLRLHQTAVESLLSNNKTLQEIQNEKSPWSFWNAMFYCGTIYTTIADDMEPNTNDSSVVRRRRKMTRPPREKTPDPNFVTNGRRRYSEDDSSQVDGTTASEEANAQIVRMQIRPPGTMSAHESKILRRRDKTLASAAARSHSQPRQAERLTSPEAHELIRTVKRSQSSPRHQDESSESELITATAERQRSTPTRHAPPAPTSASADDNLSRLQQNLLRFEEERKRFETEKRNFEREKREHRLRLKQLPDNDERKRLLQSYRKLSDRIQLPADAEERRRLVHSLRLQRHEAPHLLPRTRHSGYDESSTQFSSSDADADEAAAKRLAKQLSPVRRHASAVSNCVAGVRGPPPQPPERRAVSRNSSLSPIRPQRRSKTPEQRAEMIRKLVETMPDSKDTPTTPQPRTPETSDTPASPSDYAPTANESVDLHEESVRRRHSATRRDSLTEIGNRRKQSLERIERAKAVAAEVAAAEALEVAAAQSASASWLQKLADFLKSKLAVDRKPPAPPKCSYEPDELLLPQDLIAAPPEKVLSLAFARHAYTDARHQWFHLKAAHPREIAEMRKLRNKCVVYSIMLIMLCGFGGLTFRYTEGTSENIYKCEVRKVKRDFVDNLWAVSHNMREDDWKTLARQKLRKFEEELHALSDLGIRYFPGQKSWNFVNCILYCWTVITTIGYGHITPKTTLGQSLTIIYAIIGIPIFLIILADFGKLFTRGMKFLWAYVRRLYYTGTCREIRKQQQVRDAMSGLNNMYDMALRRPSQFFGMADTESEDIESQASKSMGASHPDTPTSPYPETFEVDDEFNLPVSVASVLLISYILIGAFVYTLWEDWTYFEAFYFVFISMSTIGFGDFVPNHPIFMMCSIIYLVFGLALTSMFINVVQIKLSDTFKQASAKIGATIGIGMASEMGDEMGSQMKTPSELASVHGSRLDKIAEDDNEAASPMMPAPTSILKQRPISPVSYNTIRPENGSDMEPPPLMSRRQVSMEQQLEPEKPPKKRGFFK